MISHPFSIFYQLYQDDRGCRGGGGVIMKGTLFMIEKISISGKARTQDHKISRPEINLLS